MSLKLTRILEPSLCSSSTMSSPRMRPIALSSFPTFYYNTSFSTVYSISAGFPAGTVVRNPCTNAGDTGYLESISGSGRSPRGGNNNPLWYSYLGNSMDRRARQATAHEVARVSHDLAPGTCACTASLRLRDASRAVGSPSVAAPPDCCACLALAGTVPSPGALPESLRLLFRLLSVIP